MKIDLMKWGSVWLITGMLFTACNTNQQNQTTPKKDTVYIRSMAFDPDLIRVHPGDTVVWINEGIVAHDISQFPARTWHSDTLQPQQEWQKVFTDSSSYFCSIHPTMQGKVLLEK